MKRVAWIVSLGMLLSACGVYRVEDASIDRVDLELMPEASAVKVVAHGVLANGCTRVGEVKQRREGETFFVTIETIYEQPAHTACTLAISEFREELILDVAGLEGGDYAVNVNGVVKTFALPLSEQRTVEAHIETVNIVLRESNPVQVVAEVTGFYGGCTTFIDISQRRESDTFFVTVLVSAPILPGEPPCPPTEYPFTEQVVLEVEGLANGVYTVDVNGVTETFELKGGGVFVESGRASLTAVEAQVLASSPGTSAVKVGIFVEGEFGDPCVDLRGVKQVREGNMFGLTLDATERIDVTCPPVGEFFWEFTLLEAQLSSGTYQVEVTASNTLTTSFELHPNATYREAKVTGLEVVPLEDESFAENVIVRGELQSSCEVIDGAVQRQEGTDRDTLPDSEFVISLISRTTGMCGNETVPFEEVIPVSSYGSGDYTVNVNGVVENFTLPGAEPFTLP